MMCVEMNRSDPVQSEQDEEGFLTALGLLGSFRLTLGAEMPS